MRSVRYHLEVLDRQDCDANLHRISELLGCGVFHPSNDRNPLQQSAFIEVVICLRDLLYKSAKYGHRVAFADDVVKNSYVSDVTDAITAIRDACCHIDSFKRHIDENFNRGSFMVISGRGTLMKIGDLELKSDYEDDIAFYYGNNRLYLRRHIIRAFEEARQHLRPMLIAGSNRGT